MPDALRRSACDPVTTSSASPDKACLVRPSRGASPTRTCEGRRTYRFHRLPRQSVLHIVPARVLGPAEEAKAVLEREVRILRMLQADPGLYIALGASAGLAVDRGDLAAADRFVLDGMSVIEHGHLGEYPISILLRAVGARLAVARGRVADARVHLATVSHLRPQITTAYPWIAVEARVHAIRAVLALHDVSTARVLLAEIDEIREQRPDLGRIWDKVDEVRAVVQEAGPASSSPWSLTSAEIRLLAYLPTHLTLREIAQRMFLSPHTVKTQAISIYGKLGASSRREALERAVDVGLLERSVLHVTEGATVVA
jgi:LuxR family maltose regulon positive regulatory protein